MERKKENNMAKLYLDNGFIDYERLSALSGTLNIVLGPRNAGKTYGALLHYTQCRVPFVFMRTAKAQIDLVFSEDLSPFNKINADTGSRYCPEKIKGSGGLIGIYDNYTVDDNGRHAAGELAGYCLSLAQVGATRGFNLDKVEVVLYDEFVKHQGEIIRNADKQFTMYADIIFTLNRAREIEGRQPIKQWLFGNSDDLSNNILMELSLVTTIINMRLKGDNYRKLPERDIAIFLLDDSPVAARLREESKLSKVFAGSSYLDMAYGNEFINDDFSDCKPMSISAFNPQFVYGRIAIYRHKSKDLYYVRTVKDSYVFNGIPSYQTDEKGRINARENHAGLYFSWLAGIVYFESYNVKVQFLRLFDVIK